MPPLPRQSADEDAVRDAKGYAVQWRNRLGQVQKRLLVLDDTTLKVLDTNRKAKTHFALALISELEIPPMPRLVTVGLPANLTLIFRDGSHPVEFTFGDEFERLFFCERVIIRSGVTVIRYREDDVLILNGVRSYGAAPAGNSTNSTTAAAGAAAALAAGTTAGAAPRTHSNAAATAAAAAASPRNARNARSHGKGRSGLSHNDDAERYNVIRHNMLGMKRMKIIELRKSRPFPCLRVFEAARRYTDIPFRRVMRLERTVENHNGVRVYESSGKPGVPGTITRFYFTDPLTREKFVNRALALRSMVMSEEQKKEGRDPKAPLRVFCGTWNLGQAPFEQCSLSDFLFPARKENQDEPDDGKPYDIVAISLQECAERSRETWILHLAQCLNDVSRERGHTQTKVGSSPAKSMAGKMGVGGAVNNVRGLPYVKIATVKLWEIVLIIFVRRPLLPYVSNVHVDHVACGIGGLLGNKGAVGATVHIRNTRMSFVGCHLAARQDYVSQRNENFAKIAGRLRLGYSQFDVLAHSDHVFWFGDLNYRSGTTFKAALSMVGRKQWDELHAVDQLQKELDMVPRRVFEAFSEGTIRFAPTYRWERERNAISNKKNQPPSWTDRVLWHSRPGLQQHVKQLVYASAPNVWGSDHRPVASLFQVSPRSAYKLRALTRVADARFIVLHSMSLVSTVIDPTHALTLSFEANWLHNFETLGAVPYGEGTKCWTWPSRVALLPFVDESSFQEVQHLVITIRSGVAPTPAASTTLEDGSAGGTALEQQTAAGATTALAAAEALGLEVVVDPQAPMPVGSSSAGGDDGVTAAGGPSGGETGSGGGVGETPPGGTLAVAPADDGGDASGGVGAALFTKFIGNAVVCIQADPDGQLPLSFRGVVMANGRIVGNLFGKGAFQTGIEEKPKQLMKVTRIVQKRDVEVRKGLDKQRVLQKVERGVRSPTVDVPSPAARSPIDAPPGMGVTMVEHGGGAGEGDDDADEDGEDDAVIEVVGDGTEVENIRRSTAASAAAMASQRGHIRHAGDGGVQAQSSDMSAFATNPKAADVVEDVTIPDDDDEEMISIPRGRENGRDRRRGLARFIRFS